MNIYSEKDKELMMEKLPEIVEETIKLKNEKLEPTIYEAREIHQIVKDFIKRKGRIIHGDFAFNELMINANPKETIYRDCDVPRLEIYSFDPLHDLIELCDLLVEKGYKYVKAREADEVDETYLINVNFQQCPYCEITYMPKLVFYGLKTVELNGLKILDPSFLLINYLKVINDPMTSSHRWEKVIFKYIKLLQYYPPEKFGFDFKEVPLNGEISRLINLINTEFLMEVEHQKNMMTIGIDAYNYYIELSRSKNAKRFKSQLPYLELISINYQNDIFSLLDFIKSKVDSPDQITMKEYHPFYNFQGRRAVIFLDEQPVVFIYSSNNQCIPNVKTTKGYRIITFQGLVMNLMIMKFRSFTEKKKEIYFNYGIMISNLFQARNEYLERERKSPLDKSPFREFQTDCLGTTMTQDRISRLRQNKRASAGKAAKFSYDASKMKDADKEKKEGLTGYTFKNTSGNVITNVKRLTQKTEFKVNEDQVSDDDDQEGGKIRGSIQEGIIQEGIQEGIQGPIQEGIQGLIQEGPPVQI